MVTSQWVYRKLCKILLFLKSNPCRINFNIILPSTPRYSRQSSSFRFLPPPKKLYAVLCLLHALPFSSSLSCLSEKYLVRSTNHGTLYYALFLAFCYFLPFRPSIFLSTLFFNTLSLCTSCNVRDQDSCHTHQAKLQFCILIIIFLDSKQEGRDFGPKKAVGIP